MDRPDSNYAFTEYHSERGVGYDAYFLQMTSQQWRSASEVDRPLWEHEVMIVIPQVGLDSTDTAVLLISGGSNGGPLTTEVNPVVGAAAIATGAVLAVVNQVPNQPLYFTDEGGLGWKEDEILAYSMDKALCSTTADRVDSVSDRGDLRYCRGARTRSGLQHRRADYPRYPAVCRHRLPVSAK